MGTGFILDIFFKSLARHELQKSATFLLVDNGTEQFCVEAFYLIIGNYFYWVLRRFFQLFPLALLDRGKICSDIQILATVWRALLFVLLRSGLGLYENEFRGPSLFARSHP